MKVLVVEDKDEKYDAIKSAITDALPWYSIQFYRAEDVIGFVKKIDNQKFDLIIFDILLPRYPDEEAVDVSIVLLDQCTETKNENTPAIALTEMASPEYDTLIRFNMKSIPVLVYDGSNCDWRQQLAKFVEGLPLVSKVDFLICCALPKEAEAYNQVDCELGEWNVERGALSWRSIKIGTLKGALCVYPKMGMTTSALYTSRAIDFFRPPVLAMSGICAGLKDECNLVDIIVPESAWDHQVGKITDDGLKPEIHLENVDPDLIARFKANWEQGSLKKHLNAVSTELSDGKFSPSLVFGPVASSSVVVASGSELNRIEGQQRKVVGVEMEIAAFLAACRFSGVKPIAFAAKAVVDFADADKSDDVHDVARHVSAHYVASMIPIAYSVSTVEVV